MISKESNESFGQRIKTKIKRITKEVVIPKEMTIKGDIKVDTKVFVEGKVEGNIFCLSSLIIGPTGEVTGEITASKIYISGYFKGKATAKDVKILKGSKVLIEN